jgi:hypothetical protein
MTSLYKQNAYLKQPGPQKIFERLQILNIYCEFNFTSVSLRPTKEFVHQKHVIFHREVRDFAHSCKDAGSLDEVYLIRLS